MPFFRIVDCQTFFAEYFCHMVVLLNIILRNGKLPNGKIAEGCCGMTYTLASGKMIIEHSIPSILDMQMVERFAYVNLSKYRPRSLHISLDSIAPKLIGSALSISTSYVKSLNRVFNWTYRMKSQKSKLEEPLLRRITFRHSRLTSNDVFEFKVENSKIADFRDILIRAPKRWIHT